MWASILAVPFGFYFLGRQKNRTILYLSFRRGLRALTYTRRRPQLQQHAVPDTAACAKNENTDNQSKEEDEADEDEDEEGLPPLL